jgi:sulfane dehydrogenase subunit SoxC
VTRTLIRSQPGTTGSGASRTPLESLDGMITPSGLHFERHHNGVPDIDPDTHRLLIHGMVKRPLIFTVDALLRYPMVSRIHFLECSGNSQFLYQPAPPNLTCRSDARARVVQRVDRCAAATCCSRKPASTGARSGSRRGADAAAMSRSVPMAKAMDDAILALFQNGERLRPENGYPVRLFLPGWEGNMSVKWLRRLKVVSAPIMTKDETSRYTDLQGDGKSLMFTYPMEVKSVITRPSSWHDAAGRRAPSDLRHRVVGQRDDQEGRGVDRRRPDVDGCSARGARAAACAHTVPAAVEVGRHRGRAQVARHRR